MDVSMFFSPSLCISLSNNLIKLRLITGKKHFEN